MSGKIIKMNREQRRKADKGKHKVTNGEIIKKLKEKEVVVPSMNEVDFSGLLMPFITLFDKPVDFPDKLVARVFELDKPTNIVCIYESKEQAREDVGKAGFGYIIPRTPEDDAHIVESYIR